MPCSCRLVVYTLLGLRSLLVGGLPLPCPPTCQCYDTSKVFCSEERMREIPAGLPGNATQLFFVETALNSVRSGALGSSTTLTKLVFLNNDIQELEPGAFRGLPSLTELEVSGNPLPAELARVGLADNPWACDCRLAYLLGWLQGFAEPLTHTQASCASPATLRGRSLLEVPQGQLECPGEPSIPPEEGWDGVPGEDAALGQCTYSNPEGTVSMACDTKSCQRLSLRLPPLPTPGQVEGLGPAYQGAWVLRSRCSTLQ
ncbi:PREDICTED: carboxypeptidase N subunit 2-like, partial [Pygoscelis adeliae]|uniref:carboxypeptidase N subunit 2-like n=1 Tax=Pygoscelis adeliae TaxID=9238 RepID=UPI0004F50C12